MVQACPSMERRCFNCLCTNYNLLGRKSTQITENLLFFSCQIRTPSRDQHLKKKKKKIILLLQQGEERDLILGSTHKKRLENTIVL
jgi:hypothetical protein